MMKMTLFFLLFFLVLTNCSQNNESKKEKYGVLSNKTLELKEKADSYMDAILKAYNSDSYELFSKNLNEKVKQNLTAEVFKEKRNEYFSKIGLYKSKKFLQMFDEKDYTMVSYEGSFEKAKIRMTLVLQKQNNNYLVSGIWFFSPEKNLTQPF